MIKCHILSLLYDLLSGFDRAEAEECFKEVDKDGGGEVSTAEFEVMRSYTQIIHIFDHMILCRYV